MEQNFHGLLVEAVERGKSNTHQISDIKDQLKEIRAENKAIISLASSIEKIALEMSYIKAQVTDVKQGQDALANKVDKQIIDIRGKVDSIERKPYDEYLDTKREFKRNTVSNIVRMAFAALASIAGTMLAMYFLK